MSQSYFLSVGGGVTRLNGSRRISGEGGGLLRFVRFPGGSWPRFRGALLSSEKCDRPTRQFEVRENRQRHRDELRVKAGGAAQRQRPRAISERQWDHSAAAVLMQSTSSVCPLYNPLLLLSPHSFTCMISTFGEKSKTRHEIDSRWSKCSVNQGAD